MPHITQCLPLNPDDYVYRCGDKIDIDGVIYNVMRWKIEYSPDKKQSRIIAEMTTQIGHFWFDYEMLFSFVGNEWKIISQKMWREMDTNWLPKDTGENWL